MIIIFFIGSVGYLIGMQYAAFAIGKPELALSTDDDFTIIALKVFFHLLVLALFYFFLHGHRKMISGISKKS